MRSDWQETSIAEITDSCLGKMLDQKKNRGNYQPYLANVNVRWGSFTLNNLPQMRFEDFEDERYGLQYGDIVLCEGGEPGRCAIWRNELPNMKFQKALHRIRVRDGVSNEFLYYWFLLAGKNKTLHSYFTGTTIQHLPGDKLKSIRLCLPPYKYQQRVASILRSLDEKIELNNRINENLQQQAQAIFKSWFVDFEPFGGVLPKDWRSGKLKDILQLKKQTIKAGMFPALPYLPIDAIPMNTFAISELRPNEEAQSSLIRFDRDDIIIGAMRVYFHRVVLAPCEGITRTTCFTLAPYDPAYLSFCLLFCDQDSSIDFAQRTSKGSTMPYAIWDGGLGETELAIPSGEVANQFNSILLPMIRQIQKSYYENKSLKDIRDTLLPKLMSGELDVSEVNI